MSDPSRVVVSRGRWCSRETCGALLRRGYRPGTAAKQLQLMAHLSRWMATQDLEPAELGVEIERFLGRRARPFSRRLRGRDACFHRPPLP